MIDPASTGVFATGVVQTDTYIAKGGGEEVWEPRFTYHGFRYVEMTGFPGTPSLENLEGVVVHSDVGTAGRFECSDAMLNRIHNTALWTEVSNLHGDSDGLPGARALRLARRRPGDRRNDHLQLRYGAILDEVRGRHRDLRRVTACPRWLRPESAKPRRRRLTGEPPRFRFPGTSTSTTATSASSEAHYDGMKRWLEHLQWLSPKTTSFPRGWETGARRQRRA